MKKNKNLKLWAALVCGDFDKQIGHSIHVGEGLYAQIGVTEFRPIKRSDLGRGNGMPYVMAKDGIVVRYEIGEEAPTGARFYQLSRPIRGPLRSIVPGPL